DQLTVRYLLAIIFLLHLSFKKQDPTVLIESIPFLLDHIDHKLLRAIIERFKGVVAKWLTHLIVVQAFVGSIPIGRPI
ncbi:hypothetical protein P6709_20365, partial [Jeotgalibacillus sp. ET6]|uniref:hypothetical protein n=1 Tax=Jeotgalibacillus sp. ET6 TaxID=3037260 RepID=UPI00241885BF